MSRALRFVPGAAVLSLASALLLPVAPAAADVSARLASLAQLHSEGELTDEEYAAAKAQVLAGS